MSFNDYLPKDVSIGLQSAPCRVRLWQILLQKSLMVLANSDSVALIRFAAESGESAVLGNIVRLKI